ncbi:hypothetical protein AYI68_g8105 [Smittium mucronatum]|uniref:Uncharacterized protein n=1 Tax=Smittium mucronatum TaxID=133383 RepID=A0A1R0GLV5_9FUNG|nr:hypothetical protein AYI68_g8105 [Smittium mucronatum]
MSEDFCRTMLTEEEKKKAIYACHNSSKVCYNPPPINEAAHAQSRRRIQLSAQFKSHQNILIIDDPVVDVLNTIRCIMVNVASIATQSRLENFHCGMLSIGKPEQVVESDTSLGKARGQSVGPERRGEEVPNTFQEIGTEQQGFRGESTKRIERFKEEPSASPKRYPDGAATINITSSAIQAEAQPRDPLYINGGGGIPTRKDVHRGGR